MADRPILFSDSMVRAIIEDRKTQTRRIVKPSAWVEDGDCDHTWQCVKVGEYVDLRRCPYGQPGDRLWVRETFSGPGYQDKHSPSNWHPLDDIWYWADGNPDAGDWTRPKPSIHMPRWASRILLEITDVRVERLKDISEADAIAEGAPRITPDQKFMPAQALEWYRLLWDQINGPGSWAANPWVWIVEFKRVMP